MINNAKAVYPTSIPIPVAYYIGTGAGLVNPGNARDKDISTFCGEGSYTGDGGVNNSTALVFDFGYGFVGNGLALKVFVKLGFRASGANSGSCYITQCSKAVGDISGEVLANFGSNPGATEVIYRKAVTLTSRYLKIAIGNSTSNGIITYLKVYEVWIYGIISTMPTPTVSYGGDGAGLTNPEYAIDMDTGRSTGEGIYTGDGGVTPKVVLTFDFGSAATRNLTAKYGFRASGVNSGGLTIDDSPDNSTWTNLVVSVSNPGWAEVTYNTNFTSTQRYLRIAVIGGTAGIKSALKVYEVYLRDI